MQIVKINNSKQRKDLIALYIEAFSTGLSKQYIDTVVLNQYIDEILTEGYALLAVENLQVMGAILCCPLKLDKAVPPEIYKNFPLDKCVYVAEMMVTESARGMGIGTKLLNEFFQTVDKSIFTDAFIRVWDENVGAISLYQKVGFEQIANIEQTKTKADGNGTFVMKKIYLHKKLV
ncbi:MAG: GNAT family N-acetyltransferase [Paludibacter sp.]